MRLRMSLVVKVLGFAVTFPSVASFSFRALQTLALSCRDS